MDETDDTTTESDPVDPSVGSPADPTPQPADTSGGARGVSLPWWGLLLGALAAMFLGAGLTFLGTKAGNGGGDGHEYHRAQMHAGFRGGPGYGGPDDGGQFQGPPGGPGGQFQGPQGGPGGQFQGPQGNQNGPSSNQGNSQNSPNNQGNNRNSTSTTQGNSAN